MHYPYLKDPNLHKKEPNKKHRYFNAMQTLDDFLKGLFDMLDRTGRLDNTIIIGAGDHGEYPFPHSTGFTRLSALNSHILHTGSYIYYPSNLMPDPSTAERLRSNTKKLTYTLDIYPTIQSIVHGGGGSNNADYLYRNHFHEGCITGVDLTSVEIPDERVTIAWNLATSVSKKTGDPRRFWALSTRDSTTGGGNGEEVTLYHRYAGSPMSSIKQGKNNTYTLLFGDCTRDTSKSNLCQEAVTDNDRKIFKDAISWIKHDGASFFNDGVKSSKLVEFFANKVGYEEATADENKDEKLKKDQTSSCGSISSQQADYRGTTNTTKSGRSCQRWDMQSPQKHTITTANYPDAGLEANYCRNADGDVRAWCYTTDTDKRWELCDVQFCDAPMSSPIRGGRRGHGRDAEEKESGPKVRARDGKKAKTTRLAKGAKDASV